MSNLSFLNGGTITITPSGTQTVVGTVEAQGIAPAGSAAAGNPLLIGARAATSEPTAVLDGQAVDVLADTLGRLVVTPYALGAARLRGSTTIAAAGSTGTIIASPGTAESILVLGLQLSNTGTVQTTATVNDSVNSGFIVAAGGGNNPQFNPPLSLAAGAALTITCSPTLSGGSLVANAQGYKSP